MSTRPNPRRANGHRRDQVRARVLREEDNCWLCGEPVDKTLDMVDSKHGAKCQGDCTGCSPHPMRAEVDEIHRVRDGGDPLDRKNCRLSHRDCNRYRDVPQPTKLPTILSARDW